MNLSSQLYPDPAWKSQTIYLHLTLKEKNALHFVFNNFCWKKLQICQFQKIKIWWLAKNFYIFILWYCHAFIFEKTDENFNYVNKEQKDFFVKILRPRGMVSIWERIEERGWLVTVYIRIGCFGIFITLSISKHK